MKYSWSPYRLKDDNESALLPFWYGRVEPPLIFYKMVANLHALVLITRTVFRFTCMWVLRKSQSKLPHSSGFYTCFWQWDK